MSPHSHSIPVPVEGPAQQEFNKLSNTIITQVGGTPPVTRTLKSLAVIVVPPKFNIAPGASAIQPEGLVVELMHPEGSTNSASTYLVQAVLFVTTTPCENPMLPNNKANTNNKFFIKYKFWFCVLF